MDLSCYSRCLCHWRPKINRRSRSRSSTPVPGKRTSRFTTPGQHRRRTAIRTATQPEPSQTVRCTPQPTRPRTARQRQVGQLTQATSMSRRRTHTPLCLMAHMYFSGAKKGSENAPVSLPEPTKPRRTGTTLYGCTCTALSLTSSKESSSIASQGLGDTERCRNK